jgi:hypothetical protein
MSWEDSFDNELIEESDYVKDFMNLTDKEVINRARKEIVESTHPTTKGIIEFFDRTGRISDKQKLVLCRFLVFDK